MGLVPPAQSAAVGIEYQAHWAATSSPLQVGPLDVGCSAQIPDGVPEVRLRVVHEMFRLPWSYHETTMIHNGGLQDESVSLANRVLLPVPTPNVQSDAWRMFVATAKKVARLAGHTQKWTYGRFCRHYKGKLKTRYENAVKSLLQSPVEKRDSNVQSFVKAEKWTRANFSIKPPRAIQARHPRYNVEMGVHLKPIEERIYRLHTNKSGRWFPRTRVIAKGLNQEQRAQLFIDKVNAFEDPVIIPLDAKKFDAHVHELTLRVEHMVYMMMDSDPEFARLLGWQLRNVGYTKHGIRYRVDGRRMSGDMNTALGNCLIMICLVASLCRRLKIKYDMMDDGDDCMLIIERADLARLQTTLPQHFLDCGFEMTVGAAESDFRKVDFCQCRCTYVNGKYKFIRNWQEVIRKSFSSNQHYRDKGGFRIMKSIAMAESILNDGVPILSKFATCWRQKLEGLRPANLPYIEGVLARVNLETTKCWGSCPDQRTREEFEEVWGTPIENQYLFESFIEKHINNYPVVCTFNKQRLYMQSELLVDYSVDGAQFAGG